VSLSFLTSLVTGTQMSVHAVAHVVAMLVMLAVVHDAGVRSR
jgi:hypothetical protein